MSDNVLEIVSSCARLDEQDGCPDVICSARILGVGVADYNEFQVRLNVVNSFFWAWLEFMAVNTVVLYKDVYSFSYTYESHCSSMDKVLETVVHITKYGFYL